MLFFVLMLVESYSKRGYEDLIYFITIFSVSFSKGSSTIKLLPFPFSLSTSMLPSDNSTILLTIASPKPLPSSERE